MKNIYKILFTAIVVIAVTFTASAQTEQTRQVSGFNGIASSGSFNVHVKIDGTESLKISGNEADLKEIETVVEDGKLQIRYKKQRGGWWNNDEHHDKIDVYVTAKSLSGLTVAGSGSIKVEGALSGDASLTVSGSGSVNTGVKSNQLHMVVSGSGSVKAEGSAEDITIAISGSGSVNSKELKTSTASVVITGSGSAKINAEKSITAHIVGSGSLNYTGNATVRDIRTVGSGRVTRSDED